MNNNEYELIIETNVNVGYIRYAMARYINKYYSTYNKELFLREFVFGRDSDYSRCETTPGLFDNNQGMQYFSHQKEKALTHYIEKVSNNNLEIIKTLTDNINKTKNPFKRKRIKEKILSCEESLSITKKRDFPPAFPAEDRIVLGIPYYDELKIQELKQVVFEFSSSFKEPFEIISIKLRTISIEEKDL